MNWLDYLKIFIPILVAFIQFITVIILVWHGVVFKRQQEIVARENKMNSLLILSKFITDLRKEENPYFRKLLEILIKELMKTTSEIPEEIKKEIPEEIKRYGSH